MVILFFFENHYICGGQLNYLCRMKKKIIAVLLGMSLMVASVGVANASVVTKTTTTTTTTVVVVNDDGSTTTTTVSTTCTTTVVVE